VIVKFGRSVPKGFLPVFSVDTEAEAEQLLVLTCPRNLNMEFVAPELVHEQTLDNLHAFSERLQKGWDMIEKGRHDAVEAKARTPKPNRATKPR
jgi:hypothetical protein